MSVIIMKILAPTNTKEHVREAVENRSFFRVAVSEAKARVGSQMVKQGKAPRLTTVSPKPEYKWFRQDQISEKGGQKQIMKGSLTDRNNPSSNHPNIRMIYNLKANKVKKPKGEKPTRRSSYSSRA